jgi:hypothetical protein
LGADIKNLSVQKLASKIHLIEPVYKVLSHSGNEEEETGIHCHRPDCLSGLERVTRTDLQFCFLVPV